VRIGRIPYINCYPVYGAIDRGEVTLDNGLLVSGIPSELNRQMASGELDISVVSAVEYARDSDRYYLLPDLAISCDGAVHSVMLFAGVPAEALHGKRVIVSRSSMTSVALLELLFESVWKVRPEFVAGDAEIADIHRFGDEAHEARLVIGDAALLLGDRAASPTAESRYAYAYDLGEEWKAWTGLPFVFAVWVAQRSKAVADSLRVHASLIESRDWGLLHLPELARQAAASTSISETACLAYLSGLDYRLSLPHLDGLTEFFRRLVAAGRVPEGRLRFLTAA
jgi:chorismate dehydratase